VRYRNIAAARYRREVRGDRYDRPVTSTDDAPATVDDVHALAAAMPHVTLADGPEGNAVYQVGGKSFVFFRNRRPDAYDRATGERYDDVIVIWVEAADDKEALVQDPGSPFFTTSHFDGHPSVLVRASRLAEITRGELAELIQDAWLSRASRRRAAEWLSSRRAAAERFEPVSPDNVDDLDQLFTSGDPRTCQCAFVRLSNAAWSAASPSARRDVHRRAVGEAAADGRAAGLIAYQDGEPVGWVSFDRREAFDRLSSSRLLRPLDDEPVWSVVCFVVAARARRSGLAGRLLDAAVVYARDHGATALEAYPVDVTTPTSTKRSAADLWRGTVPMFERAGFTTVEVRRASATSAPRPIMRRSL
jgi:GNAT superfamily N-acetyltransferase